MEDLVVVDVVPALEVVEAVESRVVGVLDGADEWEVEALVVDEAQLAAELTLRGSFELVEPTPTKLRLSDEADGDVDDPVGGARGDQTLS